MEKSFERALLLCSDRHSLFYSLTAILEEMAMEVKSYDIRDKIGKIDSRIQSQILKAPFKIRTRWENYFQKRINTALLSYLDEYKPDIVMVYNSEFLLPQTTIEIKKRSRLIFYLADSPFYTPQNNYYLTVLSHADLILSPDSFWTRQLNTVGLQNIIYCIPGPDKKFFNRITDKAEIDIIPEREVLYVGSSYFTTWGYKKALLMNKFTGLDFHLYGNRMWRRWFRFFPDLEDCFTEIGYIPAAHLNGMFNRAKLIPVDGNPGILNGAHLRTFEALSTGALPLIEYRDDIDTLLFRDCQTKLPLIRDYNKASEIAGYYLKNEEERSQTVESLLSFIEKKYSAGANALLIYDALGLKH